MGLAGIAVAPAVDGQSQDLRFVSLSPDEVLQQGEAPVGKFTRAVDEVDRLYRGEKFGVALSGEKALSNEMLSSFMEGSVTVEFLDGTQLTVGPNSEVILDEYVYDPGTNKGKMSLNILSGLVKFVSGKMDSESYLIETPVGMAAIRGTEIVFMVEADGDLTLGVFSGGVDFSVGGQIVSAEARDNSMNFIILKTEETGDLTVKQGEMSESYKEVEVVFEDPKAYSTFVAAVKTEQYKEEIIEACKGGQSCAESVTELVEELAELGVEKEEVLGSLENIKSEIVQVGGEPSAVQQGLEVIESAEQAVTTNYEPEVKERSDAPSSQQSSQPQAQAEASDEWQEAQNERQNRRDNEPENESVEASRIFVPPPLPPLNPEPTNEAPTDIELSNASISESAETLSIGVLTASDDNTTSEAMVFELISNGFNDDHLAFSLDETSRTLSFSDQPDYETQSSYSLRVRATDEEGLSFEKDLTISVTNTDEAATLSVSGPLIIEGDDGLGSGTPNPTDLSSFVTITDPEGEPVTVTLANAGGITLSPETDAGVLGGTYDGVTVNGTQTNWSVNSSTAQINITDAGGSSDSADITITGQLLIGPGDLPSNQSFTVTGGAANDYIGGALQNNSVVQSPISDVANGAQIQGIINLRGGENTVFLGDDVGQNGGEIKFTTNNAEGVHEITLGHDVAVDGRAVFEMANAEETILVFGDRAGKDGGYIQYTDSSGSDSLTAGANFVETGEIRMFFENGGTNALTTGPNAALFGTLLYYGGHEADTVTIGDGFATGGMSEIHLGDDVYNPVSPDSNSTSDSAADRLVFEGKVGEQGGTVRVYNYNSDTDQLGLPHLEYSSTVNANDDYQITSLPDYDYYSFTLYNVDGQDVLDSFYAVGGL